MITHIANVLLASFLVIIVVVYAFKTGKIKKPSRRFWMWLAAIAICLLVYYTTKTTTFWQQAWRYASKWAHAVPWQTPMPWIVLGGALLVLLLFWVNRGKSHATGSSHSHSGGDKSGTCGIIVGGLVTATLCILGGCWGIESIKHSQPPPPPPRVIGPTETLYRMEIRDTTGKLVEDLSGDYFRLQIKGVSYFEGWYPTRNDMDGPKLTFSQHLGSGEKGKWENHDPLSNLGKGYFEIWEAEYHQSIREPIHAWFWNKEKDPEKDRPWTMTLILRQDSVSNWTKQ
ncbi:MAG: hypothetical protein V4438_04500 [Patescibacteria group bacterium]